MRHTKIVATVGPASDNSAILCDLITAGVDVFRLNFSHGTAEEHRRRIRRIRQAGKETGREVAILQDLCGPKMRVGEMPASGVELVAGSKIAVTTDEILGNALRFSCQYDGLPHDVKTGDRLLLDDGKLELRVLTVEGGEVKCEVVRGGILSSRKGMNLPGVEVSAPAVTPKDLEDLAVGLEEGVDFVALSFVRRPEDVAEVRRLIEQRHASAQVIAKIERPEALARLEEILREAHGIMVARGDLGVEMDVATVPIAQKKMISAANLADRYVITATQMLESMTSNIAPTRAEVCDVANAVLDGSDALMLSGETAAGSYPKEAVIMMDRIAREVEAYARQQRHSWDWGKLNPRHPVEDALGHAVFQLVEDLDAKAIAVFTPTGGTALFLSKSRPKVPILAFTAAHDAYRRLRLMWGVEPIMDKNIAGMKDLKARACEQTLRRDIAQPGDRIIVVGGTRFGGIGSADSIEVVTVKQPMH